MTDWYQVFTGRPSPGRRSRPTLLEYLRDPEEHPEVERRGTLPQHVIDSARPRVPVIPEGARPRGQNSDRVPFRVASGQDTRPFGNDFAAWNAAVEAANTRPLPEGLEAVPEPEPEANPGRAPQNPNNIPLGVEGGTRFVATRLERGVNDRAPIEERYFPPIEGDLWDEDRQAGIRPEFDPTQAWLEAEVRSGALWREGRPSAVDMFMRVVFGDQSDRVRRFIGEVAADAGVNPDFNRVKEENRQMQERIRGRR
jgi:hypothetical protein